MFRYPDYKNPVGKILNEYLYKKYDFSIEAQVLLHSIDFLKDKEELEKWLKQGNIAISDRYFTSTIAYQGVMGFSQKDAILFAKIFKIIKPDKVIYLRISPSTSVKRKTKEKKILDRNEKDKALLKSVSKQYDKMAKENVFGKWKVVDGEESIKEVCEEIIKIISK